ARVIHTSTAHGVEEVVVALLPLAHRRCSSHVVAAARFHTQFPHLCTSFECALQFVDLSDDLLGFWPTHHLDPWQTSLHCQRGALLAFGHHDVSLNWPGCLFLGLGPARALQKRLLLPV